MYACGNIVFGFTIAVGFGWFYLNWLKFKIEGKSPIILE